MNLFFNDVPINNTDSYTYLGTILDQNLTLNTDFDKKYRKASSKLGILRKLMPLLTREAANLLYSCVIVSALKYNCIVHLNLNQSQRNKLQSLEIRANKLLGSKTTPIMNVFNMQAVLLVRKCIDGIMVPSFKNYFTLRSHRANTRNNNIMVNLPSVKLELAKGSFYFMGAKLYNSLPKHIRESQSGFMEKVKIYFK